MDIREVKQLDGVKIIDPTARRNRQFVVGALAIVALGLLGWIVFGKPAGKPAAAPTASSAPATPPAAAPVAARQATGTIAEGAAKPFPAIRLADQQPPAPGSVATANAGPAPAQAASPTSAPTSSSTSSPPSSASPHPSSTPAAGIAAASSAGAPLGATPALKLDTEFASAKRIVPFAFNRVGVGPQGRLAVKELAPMAKQADKVNVRGRTDGLGAASANRRLALARARTVYDAFVEEGVARQKMRLGYCTTCFVAPNDTDAGRRLNRRVEVELIMPSAQIAMLPKPVHAREAPPPLAPLAASATLRQLPR